MNDDLSGTKQIGGKVRQGCKSQAQTFRESMDCTFRYKNVCPMSVMSVTRVIVRLGIQLNMQLPIFYI